MPASIGSWFDLRRWWKWLLLALWAAAMIGLPLTSFPLITRLTGATVAPFSAIPIGLVYLLYLQTRQAAQRKRSVAYFCPVRNRAGGLCLFSVGRNLPQ
jgi:hypothetical protein